MLHILLLVMNRLNKTESAVIIFVGVFFASKGSKYSELINLIHCQSCKKYEIGEQGYKKEVQKISSALWLYSYIKRLFV